MSNLSNCGIVIPINVLSLYMTDHAAASEKQKSVDTEASTAAMSSVYCPAYVSAVEHPEHFWMQILTEQSPQLDSLITEMTNFYCSDQVRIIW